MTGVWPTVSVVVVSWNAKRFLNECLQSLRDTDYPGKLQIIVVDNASTDGSPNMVRTCYPETELVCNSVNLGFAKANNVGLRCCTGDYVALINSDVHMLRDCIRTLVTYMASSPTVGLAGPYIIGRDGRQQLSFQVAPNLRNTLCSALALEALFPAHRRLNGTAPEGAVPGSPTSVGVLSGCFWITHRRALNNVGLLDERFFIYAEDMDWCKRFRDAGWEVMFVPEARAVHYGGASSANAPLRFFLEKQKANLQYWRKHHTPTVVAAYWLISLLHHLLRIVGYSATSLVAPTNSVPRQKVRRSAACVRWLIGRQ